MTLDHLRSMTKGWNSYDADPPSDLAVTAAEFFVTHDPLVGFGEPRIAPSAVGGVGITYRKDDRMAYVEFYNPGGLCYFLGIDQADPACRATGVSPEDYRLVKGDIREFLGGN